MGDDREKKSWREIDASRDRSRTAGRRPDADERLRDRASKSAAYSKYKANLDKLFTPGAGGALPDSLKSQLGPTDEGSAAKKKALDDLKGAPSLATLRAYVATGQPLPDDARLLMALLDVEDEEMIRAVLSRLRDLLESGKKPNRMLLVQRLTALRNRVEERETVELVDSVRAALD